jgi:hypothetical protein
MERIVIVQGVIGILESVILSVVVRWERFFPAETLTVRDGALENVIVLEHSSWLQGSIIFSKGNQSSRTRFLANAHQCRPSTPRYSQKTQPQLGSQTIGVEMETPRKKQLSTSRR